ncbi:MAG: hypothetical protein KJ779_05550 [Firmicutes bacterium]|nr:hypothetical protein [Bacillota bacterium]
MGNVKVKGLKEFSKALEGISKEVEGLSKQKTILFDDLFTKSFMSKNTPFADFDEFIADSGFSASTQEEFDSIDETELDSFVSEKTKFSGFQEMIDSAGEEYLKKRFEKLGFK